MAKGAGRLKVLIFVKRLLCRKVAGMEIKTPSEKQSQTVGQ